MSLAILLKNKRIAIFVSVLALSGAVGCSDDEVAPVNTPPEISFAGALPRAVPRSTESLAREFTFVVGVSDPDGDPVSVHWKITRDGQPSGVLNQAQQGQPSMKWQTPMETGRDTIIVTATDGTDSTVLRETIQVGTLKTDWIQTASEAWVSADSPFIIDIYDGDFVINEKMTLTIEAASELLVNLREDPIGISVVGRLDINGTSEAPVVIRPNTRTPMPGDWRGITATPSGLVPVIDLAYTHLLYAMDAVKTNTRGNIYMQGCRVSQSKESAILHFSEDQLRVENSVISSNVKGAIRITKIATPMPSSVIISGNSITGNGDLTGQTAYKDQAGIYISIPDEYATSVIAITGNEIVNNAVPGIHLAQYCYPVINDNAIYANEQSKLGTRYNIKLEDGFGVGGASSTIDATMNFWGGDYSSYDPAVADSLIKDMVRDSEDDASIAVRVVVSPWRNARP